jgi:hypothetical protein
MTPTEIVAQAIEEHGRPMWVANVPKTIRDAVPMDVLVQMLRNAHWSTESTARKEAWSGLAEYCRDNVFLSVTISNLQKVSGLSVPTIRKFIKDRTDLFRKLQRGVWEIRDPKSDRSAQKK